MVGGDRGAYSAAAVAGQAQGVKGMLGSPSFRRGLWLARRRRERSHDEGRRADLCCGVVSNQPTKEPEALGWGVGHQVMPPVIRAAMR